MPNISFTGLGSTIDFGIVRDAILAERMKPITLLQAKGANLSSRSDALKQLNGLLTTLTTATEALADKSLGTGRSASSTSNNVATATASTNATFGSYSLSVSRLATTLTQASRSYTSKTDPILAGGATTATFELRKGGATSGVEITIDSTNDSLEGLRDAINAADAGVTASIVDISGNGTQNQLVLKSNETGASGRVELVETTGTGTGADLTIRSLNPPNAVNDFSALEAEFSLNGLVITRSGNTITDAIEGVSFKLASEGDTTINISRSTDISLKLQNFIAAYNSAQDFLNAQYTKDANGKPTGVLVGDPTLRLVQQQLRDSVKGVSNDNGGSLDSLSDIGIGRDSNGKLTLDTVMLNSKLDANVSDVQALFAGAEGKTGLFSSVSTAFDQLSDDVSGVVQNAIAGYKTSIQNINKSISDQTQRINALRDSLTRQFAVVDSAINQLNSQGSTLTTIIESMKSKND